MRLLSRPALLLCAALSACSTAGAHSAIDLKATGLSTLPNLESLRRPACIYPDYKTSADLVNFGGDAQDDAGVLSLGTAAAGGGAAQISFGIFGREMQMEPATVRYSFSPPSGDPSPGPVWIGFSNYSKQSWEWYGPFTNEQDTLTMPAMTGYTSPAGTTFVAVVVQAGAGCAVNSMDIVSPADGEAPPEDGFALCVGPGKQYSRIEDALAAAGSGAHIKVYPQAGNAAYDATALFVTKSNLTFWGMRSALNERPKLSGTGYDYSGAGSVPRAILQFQPGADNCNVRGFELFDAHNTSYNGAGIRVNQAMNVVIEDCVIHGCDMGLMSNGNAGLGTGSLTLRKCQLYQNGNLTDPGYNHNIYAGGTRLSMEGCEVYGSLTGHNVKSRAHINEIRYCYVHDSANREFDLVDGAGDTNIPGSYSIISGCVIKKSPTCDNRGVIHFGQDGGNDHDGTLYLCNNTIVTPYISPVVQLSAPNAKLGMFNCIVWDEGSGQNGQTLAAASGGASLSNAAGQYNWLSHGFSIPLGSSFDALTMYFAPAGISPPFADSAGGDYRLPAVQVPNITDSGHPDGEFTPVPDDGLGGVLYIAPFWEFEPPYCIKPRPEYGALDLGAFESEYIAP